MDEAAASAWLDAHVSRETRARLDAYANMLVAESHRQNLISAGSRETILARHIVDSAQLALLADGCTSWLDLGSGAGLPGLVVAIITGQPVVLVEERRLRSDWLVKVCGDLSLDNVSVKQSRVEQLPAFKVGAICARAFAPLPRLLTLAHRFADEKTLWLLPKGRSAREELASVSGTWQGDFRMEPSLTDAASAIIVARGVRPLAGHGGRR